MYLLGEHLEPPCMHWESAPRTMSATNAQASPWKIALATVDRWYSQPLPTKRAHRTAKAPPIHAAPFNTERRWPAGSGPNKGATSAYSTTAGTTSKAPIDTAVSRTMMANCMTLSNLSTVGPS